jgi:hypothetical protein
MDILVRESIKLIGRTERRKGSRDGEMIPCNDVRGSNPARMSGDKIQSSEF